MLVPFQLRLWLASHQIKWDPPRHTRDGQSAPSPGPGSLPRAASPPGRPARSPFWATLRRPRAPSQLRKHPWARKHVGGKRLQAASSPWPGSPPLQNGQVSGQPSWGWEPALGQRDAVRPSRHPARGLPGPGRRGPGAAARKAQPGHVDTAGEGRLRSRDLLWITCPGYDTVSAFPESSTRLCTTRPEETRKPRGTRTPQPGSPGGRLQHAAPTSVAFSERSHVTLLQPPAKAGLRSPRVS